MVEVATPAAGKVTLTIRPEQVHLSQDAGAIPATITNLVYFGTDTHAHARLSDGSAIVARIPAAEAALTIGQTVGLRFAPGAAQVLED